MKKAKVKKSLSGIMGAVLLLGLLTACGSANAPEVSTEPNAQAMAAEKVLHIGELWAIDGIDPVNQGTLVKEKALVTEVLCEANEKFELIPGLATEWTHTDDNTWVFTIRQGVKFHDGTAMDAEAVAWSINNALAVNPTLVTSTNISSVSATGDYEVTIATSKPNAELPEYMHLSGFGIIAAGTYDNSGNFVLPIGTGPYKVDTFNNSTGVLTVIKNNDYYGTKPSIDKVVITGMTDPSTRALALESGEIDFTCDVPFNETDRLDALDKIRIEKYVTARTYCINLNCGDLFSDKKVRQAASLAMDRETIANDVLYGCGSVSKSMYTDNMAWDNTEIDGAAFDLEQAKKLMAEAGWSDSDGDGYLDKDGRVFEFTLITYTQRPGLPLIAEALQAQLKELGMKVNVTTMDSSAITEHIKSGKEWGMYLSGSATCMAPSCVYFLENKYYSSNISAYGYSNAEMDSMIDKCKTEFDTAERYEISKQIQALAMDELPVIYVCNYGVAYGFNEKVSNFKFNPTAHDYMWNVDIQIN
ncbi:MAG: ABC transporter substrate-binding protein [Clostridiales bacterium]|jgi:peptide/nickel transport system substrate-binding protein|nr:ABC transporter substrate-binding protein [Clostridiales bacterium]